MNIKKAQWIKKPFQIDKVDLHTLSFTNKEESSVFFILGEEGRFTLSYCVTSSILAEFVFLHTANDYIVFSENEIRLSFFGLESKHNVNISLKSIEIVKEDDTVIFLSEKREILRIRNRAFSGSISFGLRFKGEGRAEISVW